MTDIGWVGIAAIAFVGTHFLLSHPLRKPLSSAVGEPAFLGIYSLISIATFSWMVLAYLRAPPGPFLWPVGALLWALVSILMLFASILLLGSLVRNPAFPGAGAPGPFPAAARGVYSVTRHPMMWSFALWGVCHIAIFPVPKNIVLATAVVVLALVGAHFQDLKKARLQPDRWPAWQAATSYWPLAAVAQGRARLGGFGPHALLGGAVTWLVATWAHIPLAGVAAGLWRWIH